MVRIRFTGAALLLVLVSACGIGPPSQGPSAGSPPLPADPKATAIVVDLHGGFVPYQVALGNYPEVVIRSDGLAVTPGVMPLQHPGPALPAFQSENIATTAVSDLIRGAIDTGLFDDGGVGFGNPPIADAPTTTVSAWIGGELKTVSVYALGIATRPDDTSDDIFGMTPQQEANRRAMQELVVAINGSLTGGTQGFEPDRWQVRTFDYQDPGDPIRPDAPIAWPLSPSGFSVDVMCQVLGGAEWDTVARSVGNATSISPWLVDGVETALVFAPLFEHQTGCS